MSVSSSIARSKCSSGIVPSSAAETCVTRAPRASCACQICPIVGNSQSVSTTFERFVKRRPLASALTPAESDVVTAISSGPALTRPAKAARAASWRSIQYSQGAPFSSQSARYCPYADADRVRQCSLRTGVDVHLLLEDREAVTAAVRDRRRLNGQGRPFADPRARAAPARGPRARAGLSRGRSRDRRSRVPCWHSARRRASRRRTRAPAG